MKQFSILLVLLLAGFCRVQAQQYATRSATARFTVSAPAKTIEGSSDSVVLQADLGRKQVRLEAPVSSFGFRNNFLSDSLNAMIRHRFRHYYLEADRYPVVTYTGVIQNAGVVNLGKNGRYPVQTEGVLTLHGVAQPVKASGYFVVAGSSVTLEAELIVIPSDYKIRIPPYIGDMYFKKVNIQLKARLTKQTVKR